jgi:hypothetical protein
LGRIKFDMLDLDINILSPLSFSAQTNGRDFMNLFIKLLPELVPDKYGNCEPLKTKFDPENVDEFLDALDFPVYWKRKRSSNGTIGTIDYFRHRIHTQITISGKSSKVDPSKLIRFIQDASILLCADFAYISLFSQEEADLSMIDKKANEISSSLGLGVTTHRLRKYLPELCWATLFGKPYIELFSRDRLLSAPAFSVQELSKDLIYLQLTENVSDFKTRYAEVNPIQKAVKEHLNCNAFFAPDAEYGHKYNVPIFHLGEQRDLDSK